MKKFAYLTSVSTFIFSCAPALVSDVTILGSQKIARKHTWPAVVMSSLTVSFLLGVTGLVRRVCRREPRQRAYCREGFHRHFPFQHPPIPPGHAAPAHRRHGAGMATANPESISKRESYFRLKKKQLRCSLTPQTTVSRKRLEKFLGGDDLDSDIVRHDPSFSTFKANRKCTCYQWFESVRELTLLDFLLKTPLSAFVTVPSPGRETLSPC